MRSQNGIFELERTIRLIQRQPPTQTAPQIPSQEVGYPQYQPSTYNQPGEGSGGGQAAFCGDGGSDTGVSYNHPSSAYEHNQFGDDAGA